MPGKARYSTLAALRVGVCRKTGLPLAILFWCVVAGAWGVLMAWFYRHFANPDGICYLDLASNASVYGPRALVNPYWSPLYPALIALWNLLIRPSPFQEFASVHALNAVIFFATSLSFGFFLRELILFRAPERGDLQSQGAFIAFAFALLLCYLNGHITPFALTPDILLAATQFSSAALFFRILRGTSKLYAYVALGCVLALGYYAKSIMLPAGVVLLGILFVCRYRSRAHLKNVLIAAAAMLLVCAPQIAMISSRVGHFSIAETGRLNYLWWVQGVRQFGGWTGTPGGDMPIHGPRVIAKYPEVLEFAMPISGTYPLWYDPTYWYAGAKVRFNLKQQWAALRVNLLFYKNLFFDLRYPLQGLVVFIVLAISARRRPSAPECWFMLWPLAMLIMYALLITEYRYVASSLILFWVSAYSSVLARNGAFSRLLLIVLAAVILTPRLIELNTHRSSAKRRHEPDYFLVARDLNQMGIEPGDSIATVGEAFGHYYARTARVHIVAQITDANAFWSLSPSSADAIERAVAGTGAKILMGLNRPPAFQSDDWHIVPGTSYSVLRLR
jgi:hypothetical protein